MAVFPNLQTRQDLLDSATRITHLTQQPSDFLIDILVRQQQYACIEWIFHFKILEAIPLPPQSITYADVAAKLQVSASTLRSVTRMAMTADFLTETKDGALAHNPLSLAIATDEDLATWLSYIVNRSVPSMRSYVQATEKWPNATKGHETAYSLAMGTELSFFDHLEANPHLSAQFTRYMKSQSTVHAGTSVDHLLKGLDWAALGGAKVVDVGGNNGSASIALAKAFPDLRFVVQDFQGPVQQGREQAALLPADVAGRIDFQEHDFFTPQPVKDADVYLLRMILHDWPDVDAIRILKELVEVMKEGSRIVIMDIILPTPGTTSPASEAILRQKDLLMRQLLNAKEREVEDWRGLLREVDERLHIVGIRRPEASQLSILEIARSPAL